MIKQLTHIDITEDVCTQDTIAEVVKLLLLDGVKFNDNLQGKILEIKPFDNCRESGYMYRVLGSKQDCTFCVYEHRNSDEIIINGCLTQDVKSYGAYGGSSKWDYLYRFSYDEYYAVAKRLGLLLEQCYLGVYNV